MIYGFVVDMFYEGGAGVEALGILMVAQRVGVAEDGGEGVRGREAGAVGCLLGGAGVVDLGGHATDALLVADDVVDVGTYVSLELGGDGVVEGCGHDCYCLNALMLECVSGNWTYFICDSSGIDDSGVVDCWGTVGLRVVDGARMGAIQWGKDRNIFRINKLWQKELSY